MTTIASAVRRFFLGIVHGEVATLEQRLEPLAKSDLFDLQLKNEIGEAYAHLVAARIRAAELVGAVSAQ